MLLLIFIGENRAVNTYIKIDIPYANKINLHLRNWLKKTAEDEENS